MVEEHVFWLRRRKRGKIIEEGKYFFVEERKNREAKGGKYLEKKDVTMAEQTNE